MSLVAEFSVPTDDFALDSALDAVPEMRVEVERLATHSREWVMPFVWATGATSTPSRRRWPTTSGSSDSGSPRRDSSRRSEHFGSDFELHRKSRTSDAESGEFGLTPRQRGVLVVAARLGYYDIPRTVDLRGVGERLGISRQAVSERLRRGHELPVADLLGERDERT